MNDVEEVKNRLDIVEVIGGYVPLKQAGRNHKGLSPFKTEKTPSFMVSAEKGIWHDFSTGKGGDVISFVMLMEGLEFRDALEMLAKRAGVQLKPRSKNASVNQSKKVRLYEAVELAMRYYHYCLGRNKTAFDYFTKQRRLKPSTIKNFKLGYSPDGWENLKNFLIKKGFTQTEIKEAGLATNKPGSNSYYDVFRGRVMFPVFDAQNRPIGFSARILGDQKAAKYINSPQSLIYDKSTAIYGYAQAKEAIRVQEKAVIVEGNMDVLALHDAGFQNVVACSGTALTTQQIKTLSYLTPNVFLCFDNDEAGFNATLRAIEVAADLDVRLFVITLDGVKDPGELKQIKADWPKATSAALYAPDYILSWVRTKFDLSTALGKRDATTPLVSMLERLDDDIERSHYLKKCSQLLDVSEAQLFNKLGSPKRTQQKTLEGEPVDQAPVSQPLSRQQQLELSLFELLLVQPQVRDVVLELDLSKVSERFRPYMQVLSEHLTANLETIAKALPDKENAVKIAALRGEQEYSDLSEHDARLEAYTQLHRLQHYYVQLNKHQLAHAIAEAEAAGEHKQVKKLLAEYQQLLNQE